MQNIASIKTEDVHVQTAEGGDSFTNVAFDMWKTKGDRGRTGRRIHFPLFVSQDPLSKWYSVPWLLSQMLQKGFNGKYLFPFMGGEEDLGRTATTDRFLKVLHYSQKKDLTAHCTRYCFEVQMQLAGISDKDRETEGMWAGEGSKQSYLRSARAATLYIQTKKEVSFYTNYLV